MSQLLPTQTLPGTYHPTGQLDLNENRGLAMILNLTGVGLLFGVAWLLVQALTILRPTYLSSENILIITGMREFWRGVLLLVLSLGLMIILNEGFRWLLFWIITKKTPKLSFHGFYTFATAPEWYIPRGSYVAIRLIPPVMIVFFGLISVLYVPLNLVPGVLLLISLNVATALNDIVMVWWVLTKPKDILVTDCGDSVWIYHYENTTP